MVEASNNNTQATHTTAQDASSSQQPRVRPCLKNKSGLPWFQCALHLKFDLQIGAIIDSCYPNDSLSDKEKLEICNLAFPESSGAMAGSKEQDSDMYFTFRMRQRDSRHTASSTSIRNLGSAAFGYSYGYALFSKRRDSTSARGWTQQSYVILSELHLVGFFYRLLQHISQLNLQTEQGSNCSTLLQQMHEQSVNEWPEPQEALSIAVKLNLLGELQEEMIVILPENLFQGLHSEQLVARDHFRQQLELTNNSPSNQSPQQQEKVSSSTDDVGAQQSSATRKLSSVSKEESKSAHESSQRSQEPQPDIVQVSAASPQVALPTPSIYSLSPSSGQEDKQTTNSDKYALEEDFEETKEQQQIVLPFERISSCQSAGLQGLQGAQHDEDNLSQNQTLELRNQQSAQIPSQTHKHLQMQAKSRILQQHLMKQFYDNQIHGIGNELKIEEVFQGHHILQLWALWELLITETPLLVVGSDPSECSHAILTMLSLITPLTTQADFRPYVTVQNDDVLEYHDAIRQGQVGNLLLGISSPLLARNFQQFPAILRMDAAYYRDKKWKDPKQCELNQKVLRAKRSNESERSLLLNNGLERVQLQLLPQNFVFDHFDLESEDRVTLNDFNMRSHFKHMTKTLLDGLAEHWCIDPNYPELLKPFNEKEFLKSLNKDNRFCRQFMLGKVDKCKKLYKRFVNTTLFHKYLNAKRKEALSHFQ